MSLIVSYETAIENYNLLKNLELNTKMCVNKDGKLSTDRRWFSGARRWNDGSSRKDLIQPIHQTFMKLMGRRDCSKEELLECLEHTKECMETLYPDYDDLNELTQELLDFVEEHGNPNSVEDESESETDEETDGETETEEEIEAKVQEAIEQGREDAEEMQPPKKSFTEVFDRMMGVMDEESESLTDSGESQSETESDTLEDIVDEIAKNVQEVTSSVSSTVGMVTSKIHDDIQSVNQQFSRNIEESSSKLRAHLDEVRINIPNFPELVDLDEDEDDCLQRVSDTLFNVSNAVFDSLNRFMDDLGSAFDMKDKDE